MLPLMHFGRDTPARNHESLLSQQVIHQGNSKPIVTAIPPDLGVHRLQLVAQQNAQIQRFQIDQAIRLLQSEYNSIMNRVLNQSAISSIHNVPCRAPLVGPGPGDIFNLKECPQLEHANQRNLSSTEAQSRKRDRDDPDEEQISQSSHGKVVLNSEVSDHLYERARDAAQLLTAAFCRLLAKYTS